MCSFVVLNKFKFKHSFYKIKKLNTSIHNASMIIFLHIIYIAHVCSCIKVTTWKGTKAHLLAYYDCENSGNSVNHWISLQGISLAQMLSYREFFLPVSYPHKSAFLQLIVLHAGAQERNSRAGQFLNKNIWHCNDRWQTKVLPKCEIFRFQAIQTYFRCAVFVSFKFILKFIEEVTCFHLKIVFELTS